MSEGKEEKSESKRERQRVRQRDRESKRERQREREREWEREWEKHSWDEKVCEKPTKLEVVNRGLAICKIFLYVGSFQAILKVCARTYPQLPVGHSEL